MRLAILLAYVLVFVSPGEPQSTPVAKGPAKASLEGSVVKEPGGEPLKKAIVELIAENQEEGGNYTATSDPDGHFEIVDILPGRYKLFVERTGYLEVDQKRRRSSGVALSFEAGQELKAQTLHMLPAAIITGRIMDEDGDPMSNADVTVLRRKYASGRVKFEPAGSAQTNDLGEYRIGGLLSGKYYVAASPPANFQSLVPPQSSTVSTGSSPGDAAYVTTYYPNTADRAQAAAIELHAGDEMPLDLSFVRTHTARIRGSVVGLAPETKAVVMLRSRDSNTTFMGAEVDKDGKFEIPRVAPGAYTVIATTFMVDTPRSARRNIDVADANIEGLRLLPLAGATVHGRVHLAGGSGKNLPMFFVSLARVDGEDDSSDLLISSDETSVSSSIARTKADGSFELKNVPQGLYEVNVTSSSNGATDPYVDSVVVGTKEVGDTGVDVNGGTLAVDVSLSSAAGAVHGAVTNEKKERVANALVVAVPEARYQKRSSRYQRTMTDQDGNFTLRALRPGAYTLFAWEELDGDDYLDPEFMAPLEGRGISIKVGTSSRQTVVLKAIAPTPDQP
jgi:protocatechuate 3,4-dioxygenase beta subunit